MTKLIETFKPIIDSMEDVTTAIHIHDTISKFDAEQEEKENLFKKQEEELKRLRDTNHQLFLRVTQSTVGVETKKQENQELTPKQKVAKLIEEGKI